MRHRFRLALYQDHPIDANIVDYLESLASGRRQEMLRILLRAGFATFHEGDAEKARLLLAAGTGGDTGGRALAPAPAPPPVPPARLPPGKPAPSPVCPPNEKIHKRAGEPEDTAVDIPVLTEVVEGNSQAGLEDGHPAEKPSGNPDSVKSTREEIAAISTSQRMPDPTPHAPSQGLVEEPPMLSSVDQDEEDDDIIVDGLQFVREKAERQ